MQAGQGTSVSDAYFSQVQRRMVESGEWDRISYVLAQRLNENGWIDDLHHKSKELARDLSHVTVARLEEELGPHAEGAVPSNVKEEASALIRQYLDSQFEK